MLSASLPSTTGLSILTSSNNSSGKTEATVNTMATSFVPAPEDDAGEGKLLISGGVCWNRNKVPKLPYDSDLYKPAALSNLSDELFYSFIKDLQLSMRARWPIYWPISIAFFVLFVVLPLFIPLQLVYCYVIACLVTVAGLIWIHHNQHADLRLEMVARIKEWQPLFSKEGFSVDYVVDKSWWTFTESYIHIHRSFEKLGPTGPLSDEEAKYLLLFPRLFRHRNKTFRVMAISREPTYWLYSKPPSLRSLSDDVFMSLMKDMDIALRAFSIKKRNLSLVLLLVWLLVNYTSGGNAAVAMPLLVVFLGIDQLISVHLPVLSSHIPAKIQEWKSRLNAQGFDAEYRIDQPAWYNSKESYLHIRRLPQSSVAL